MTKRRKEAKRKGAPKRGRIPVVKEQTISNSVEAVDDITNASSSPGTASAAQVEPMVLRPLTRSAKRKKAALDTPSRTPLRNNDGNPSEEAATLLLVKQILFESHRVDKGDHVPVEALSAKTPVQAKNDMTASFKDKTVDAQNDMTDSSKDKTVDAQNDMMHSSTDELPRKNVLDLKKFAWDLLIQTQQPEPFQVVSTCSDEIMVNINLAEKEANVGDIITNETEDTANGAAQISENPTSPTRSISTASLMDDKYSPIKEVMSEPGAEDTAVGTAQISENPTSPTRSISTASLMDAKYSPINEVIYVLGTVDNADGTAQISENPTSPTRSISTASLMDDQYSPIKDKEVMSEPRAEDTAVGTAQISENPTSPTRSISTASLMDAKYSPINEVIYVLGTVDNADGTAQISENPTSPTHSIPAASLMDNKSPIIKEVMSVPGAEDNFIDVRGYKMKKEVAPLLEAIFNKYGDIAKESTFSTQSRTCLLDLVCSIYKRLEASKFMQLEPWELESMHGQVGDLELVKVDVGWLHRRLDQISKAQQMCEAGSTLEDIKARSLAAISEKRETVKICVEEFKASMAAALKLQEKLQREKDELSAEMSFADGITNNNDGSLVKGLV